MPAYKSTDRCEQAKDRPSSRCPHMKCQRHIWSTWHICSGQAVKLHKGKKKQELTRKKARRNHCEVFQAKPEHFQNKTS